MLGREPHPAMFGLGRTGRGGRDQVGLGRTGRHEVRQVGRHQVGLGRTGQTIGSRSGHGWAAAMRWWGRRRSNIRQQYGRRRRNHCCVDAGRGAHMATYSKEKPTNT